MCDRHDACNVQNTRPYVPGSKKTDGENMAAGEAPTVRVPITAPVLVMPIQLIFACVPSGAWAAAALRPSNRYKFMEPCFGHRQCWMCVNLGRISAELVSIWCRLTVGVGLMSHHIGLSRISVETVSNQCRSSAALVSQ